MNLKNFEQELERKLKRTNKKNVVFVCIGCNEIAIDSIGPKIGSNLEKILGNKMIIGSEKNNIKSQQDLIKYFYRLQNKLVIAIDSALPLYNISDEIFINNKPIIMGKALNKNKGIIGNIGIKIVTKELNYQNKEYIRKRANEISQSILRTVKN